MLTTFRILHILLPIIAIALMVYGVKFRLTLYVSSALWLSLIALILHYMVSGGELLGPYFGYGNAAMYSINLIVMLMAVIYLLSIPQIENRALRILNGLLKLLLIIGTLIVLANIWINAYFIETRMPGTPVMQVSTVSAQDHCKHHYVFYKIDQSGSIQYLCPNQYVLLPGIGKLNMIPEFISRQLSQPILKSIFKQQQNKTDKPKK